MNPISSNYTSTADYAQALIKAGWNAQSAQKQAEESAKLGLLGNTQSSGATGTNSNSSTPNNAFDFKTSDYDYKPNQYLEAMGTREEKWIDEAAQSSGLIDSNFLSTLSSKPEHIAFYVNALAYGGYKIGDVLNDMKRREMIYNNDPKAKSMPAIINPDIEKKTYLTTADGQRSVTEAASILPTFNLQGLFDPEILKYGADIPDDAFKMLVPLLDIDSQEFKDAVANVKSAYYDIADQKLRATNEQEKAVADYNEAKFKEQINKQYGIILSDNAETAWKQLETLGDTFNTRGIAGSGMQNEEVDNYLKTVRKQDSRYRDEKLTKEEADKASYYRTSASEAEIAALTPEERAKWGLTPSADLAEKYSMASLKARFPDSTEAELQAMRDATIDKNGNYRSAIYSKYYTSVNVTNDSRKSSAEAKILKMATDKEKAAYPDETNVLERITGGAGTVNSDLREKKDGSTADSGANATDTQTGAQTGAQTVITPPPSSGSMSTDDVKKLQDYLVSQGLMSKDQVATGYGTYGPQTTAAVKKLQDNLVKSGLMSQATVSGGYGIYGPQTTAAVNALKNLPTNGPIVSTTIKPINLNTGYSPTSTSTANSTQPYTPYTPPKTPVITSIGSTGSTYTPPKTPVAPIIGPTYTPPKTPVTPTPSKTGYQGSSIVDYLNSIGQDSSRENRNKLGGAGYVASAAQNEALLKKLRGY